MTVYESLKGRFQILNIFIRFYKYVEPRLKLRLIKNKEVSVIQIWDTFNIFFEYFEQNMELWLIKIGDVPDLATSLYHMFRFQIWDTFFNFDDNVKWNKIFWPILNLWKISFVYYIYSLNSTNMLSPAWNYGWLKIKRFLFSDMRYIQSFIPIL